MDKIFFISLYIIGSIHIGAFYHQEAQERCFGAGLFWKTLAVSAAWPATAFVINTGPGLENGCKKEPTK